MPHHVKIPSRGRRFIRMGEIVKTNHILVPLILGLSALLFIGGVIKKVHGMSEGAREKTIAVIPKGTANMWWATVSQGAAAAAREGRVKILWTGPEMETDRERQIQAVNDVLVRRVDAVVLGPNDYNALARSVDAIAARGIPVIIIDSPVNTERYDAFAGTDNYQGGAAGARRLARAVGGRGRVILTHFVQNSASTEARARGFKETLAQEFPEMELAAEQYTLGTVEDARQRTTDMLTRHPDVVGVFAVNHPASVGAYKALQGAGVAGRVKYVGFDSDPVLLDGIVRGEVEALIVQNPYEIGYRGVQLALDRLNGKPVARQNNVPSMEVDQANLETMKQRYPSALGL